MNKMNTIQVLGDDPEMFVIKNGKNGVPWFSATATNVWGERSELGAKERDELGVNVISKMKNDGEVIIIHHAQFIKVGVMYHRSGTVLVNVINKDDSLRYMFMPKETTVSSYKIMLPVARALLDDHLSGIIETRRMVCLIIDGLDTANALGVMQNLDVQ